MIRIRFAIWTMLVSALFTSGCNSEKRAAERRAALNERRQAIEKEIADLDLKIKEAEKRWRAIEAEQARWEGVWEASVTARHPEWTADDRNQQFAILRLKWDGSNRSDDNQTFEGMKRFGWLAYPSKLVNDDYWDIIRARNYRLFTAPDLSDEVAKKVNPLSNKKSTLQEQLRGIEYELRQIK